MPSQDMVTVRNKRTGEIRKIPRSQFNNGEAPEPTTGFKGIGKDITNSLSTVGDAALDMASSIPGGIKNVVKYATSNHPVETLGNLGAGGVESGAALLSSPQVLMRYLAKKFPKMGDAMQRGALPGTKGINDPTLYEGLMNFEKEHGLGAQSPEEESVRSAGGLLFGGGALKNLSRMLTKTAAITGEQAGRGGDPVHAAVLGMAGELVGKGARSNAGQKAIGAAKSIPGAAVETVKNLPEMAGRTTASALEHAADYASELPGGKLLKPITHPIGGMLASKLKHLSVAPEELAKRNLFEDINPEDLQPMLERDAAAKRLDLKYVTIPELLESPFESAKQADMGRTKAGMKNLYKAGKEREVSEGSAINKLLNLIHTEELDPIKKEAYAETMQQTVPNEFIESQTQKPAIQKAMKMVRNNTAFKQLLHDEYGVDFEKVPANSVMFWDMVKRALYDLENKSGRKGGHTESSVYGNTRKSMVEEMDKILPRYEEARNIAERGFIKNELKDVFNKKDKTFNNFDSYLKDKENYEHLLKRLNDLPRAKQQLEDIKMFSGKMIPLNPTARAAAVLKRHGMSDARNALEAKKREYDQKYGAEHDVAAVNLMTNPRLMEILTEYLNKK